MSTGAAIGIDLGTSFSCVGVLEHGRVEIVANDQGHRTTPSCVAFTDKERLFGEAAMNQMVTNPTNTVSDLKRLIGRTFDDEAVQDGMKHWPYKVITSKGVPEIEVEYCGQTKRFLAEQISAMVLVKMKEMAEAYLGEKVTDAVITVPACFNVKQRQATIDAGKIAGLHVLRLINEPTAAAIAYSLERRDKRQCNVLVFDWGGGTFDVSILSIENGTFEVKAVGGDTHLGGEDINSRLLDHFVEEFKRGHEGGDLTTSAKAISRLREACETAKRKLSTIDCTNVEVESLFEGINFCADLTRAKLEWLCSDLFSRMMDAVKSVLSAAKMKKTGIHEILLVGGSTRIPKVQTMLQDFFNGRQLNRSVNADEAVAYGATLLAAKLTGAIPESMQNLRLLEVAPMSLGLEFPDGTMQKMLVRNTQIPMKQKWAYTTPKDDSVDTLFRIFEGECEEEGNSYTIADFSSTNFSVNLHGLTKFHLTFTTDESGILHVSVVEKSSRKQKSIRSINYKGGLSEEEIERMTNDAEKFKQVDEKERSRMAAKNGLVDYIYSIKEEMGSKEMKQRKLEENRQKVIRMCEEMINWTNTEKNAKEGDYKRMRRALKKMYTDITMIKRSADSDHGEVKRDTNSCGHPNTCICILKYNKKQRNLKICLPKCE
ncbi:heat shock protein 70 [Echinococcus multilocularis]|uniref:Heat shock protein 70 n=1 Tax=Echinococcus multilocularis TaxID=6211 RepID=A0A068XVP6_ECHMU|nr:heat shock protein 70 [Echinococcus multilocularis]